MSFNPERDHGIVFGDGQSVSVPHKGAKTGSIFDKSFPSASGKVVVLAFFPPSIVSFLLIRCLRKASVAVQPNRVAQ